MLVLLPHFSVASLQILQYLFLFVRFGILTPLLIYYISSEDGVRGKQNHRPFHSYWKRTLFERFVLSIVKKYIPIPCARDVTVLLDDVIGFNTLECLISIAR